MPLREGTIAIVQSQSKKRSQAGNNIIRFVFVERVGIFPSPLTAIPGVGSLGLGEADALDLVGPMVVLLTY